MAFFDPVTLDFNGVPKVCTRVSVGDFKSLYKDPTGDVTFSASTAYGRRTRSTVRVDFKMLVADPEIPSTNNPISTSSYLVIDRNAVGFTPATLKAITESLCNVLLADDSLLIDQLLTGQS